MDWKIRDSILRENSEIADLEFEDEDFTSRDGREEIDVDLSDSDGREKIELDLPEGSRLDVGVTELLGKSRSFIQGLIADGHVTVNGSVKKANYKIRSGDRVGVVLPPPKELEVVGENIPLEIIYEDEDLLIVNKPQGMVVHPAPGAWTGTLVNGLVYHCKNLSGINGVLRPGIVHRIDKDTSGLLAVAKNDLAHKGLAEQLKAHSVIRQYKAIVHGVLSEPSGTVNAPIGRDPGNRKKMTVIFRNSKEAVTHYEVLERFGGYSYIKAGLETGRTHQIRVHMAYLNHPILGDPLYGPRKCPFGLERQMLHAAFLGFHHPRRGEFMEFEAPLPQSFREVLENLRENG